MKKALGLGAIGCGALLVLGLCVGGALAVALRGGLLGAPAPALHGLRTPVPDGTWTLTVGTPWPGGAPAGEPGPWVIVPVGLHNGGDAPAALTAGDFRLTDPAGRVYAVSADPAARDEAAALAVADPRGGMTLGEAVPPAAEGRFWLVFDVSPRTFDAAAPATGWTLTFLRGDRPAVALGR